MARRLWADALALTMPEDTMITRAFSGRPGRSIANDYVRAAARGALREEAFRLVVELRERQPARK